MRYYIIETQARSDGDVNFVKTEKYNFASAMSYYYTRKAAYLVDATYTAAAIMVCDANLAVIEQCEVETQYKA